MTHATLTYITLSFVVLLLILLYIMRAAFSYRRKKDEEADKDATEVGFVVDAFHGLVTSQKEKERELEILRKQAEERATAIESYNEDILQSVPSGVVSFDRRLTITRMNSAAEKILDLREADSIGMEYHEIFASPIRELLENRETVERIEAGYVTVTGRRIWLGLNMSPLKDSTGAIIGQILVFTDLTELKAFQSQKELRERLSNLGEMSAGIAHELRNPMAVISGYTKILSRKVDETLQPAVEAISKEVSVMDRIIADFLSFARPTELMLTRVDPGSLIEGCVAASDGVLAGIRVVTDYAVLPAIMADEVLLRQTIINLLQNAAESMPDGGVLTIRTLLKDRLSISISDTGHGIPENIQDKIFLPFFTTKERGTGLGLSIVHKVVISHGGSLDLETSSKGTTFVINLPKDVLIET
ncbi:MAG: PAS domain-containing protein [Nitrospirae bacterium]|nr:MAG: PAS domain-containing protein [Nitrospirota bacterium]